MCRAQSFRFSTEMAGAIDTKGFPPKLDVLERIECEIATSESSNWIDLDKLANGVAPACVTLAA